MKNKLLVISILLLGFIVRFKDFSQFPVFGETQDELAWTWLGTSLLQGEKPTTWSGTNLTGYDAVKEITLAGQDFRVVTPYLDNPYFFSLIPGSAALIRGYEAIEIPSLSVIRFPMVLLGTLNIWLLYLVVKKLMSPEAATISALLYATIPTFVFTSRMVVAENFLISLMLIAMLLVIKIEMNKDIKWAVYLGLVGGLALLTKVSGLAIPVASFVFLINQKKVKPAILASIITLVLGSLYFIYGFWEAPELFKNVLLKQSDFSIGLSTILSVFVYPQLVQKTFMDGWVYLGLFALIWQNIFHRSTDKTRLVSIFVLVWMGFLLTATPEVVSHGWYKYPLFPLMAMCLGFLLKEIKKHTFSIIFIALLVFLPTLRLFLLSQDLILSKNIARLIMALPFLIVILPPSLTEGKNGEKMYRYLFFILLFLNCATVFSISEITYWEDSLYYYPIRQGL